METSILQVRSVHPAWLEAVNHVWASAGVIQNIKAMPCCLQRRPISLEVGSL